MYKKYISVVLFALCALWNSSAWAFPGILQIASRTGFWANDFPDTAILLQHFYINNMDQVWDANGDEVDIQDLHLNASFTRLVRPWHFGDDKQYQYILEGIIPMYNISGEEEGSQPSFTESGVGHPLVYTSLGWNNPDKTSHVQGAFIWQVPLGDNDVMQAIGAGNNHAVMPLIGFEQRMGNLKLDASVGYWHNFEDLDTNEKQRDYFEVNGVLNYSFSTKLPCWAYVQSDYTKYLEGEDAAGKKLGNDGFNWAVAPGFGVAIRPNMTLDLKHAIDVDGENTLKGKAFNLRLLWVF